MNLVPCLKFAGLSFCRVGAIACVASLLFTCGCHQRTERETFLQYKAKATKGNGVAQKNLANCYFAGQGVTQDYSEAVNWYRKAAEQNVSGAQVQLGYCYENGKGVEKDDAEAVKWHRKAAEQNNVAGQLSLSKHYADGTGVEKNCVEAYALINLVAKTHGPYGSLHDDLGNLEKQMSPHQVAAGNKRMRELEAQIAANSKSGGK